MTLRLNMNLAAFTAHRFLNANGDAGRKSREKLSSGLRINRAADDAAGLAVSEKMRAQTKGLAQASRNALDGISFFNTAEGALSEVHAMLQRMRELAVQAANGTYSDADRANIGLEMRELNDQISSIALQTKFNWMLVFGEDGPFVPKSLTLQVGAYAQETMSAQIGAYGNSRYDVGADGIYEFSGWQFPGDFPDGFATWTRAEAEEAISGIDDAVHQISQFRARLGAYTNRLEHVIANLGVSRENVSASESRIRDADMAEELTLLTRSQILSQAATAMLAQANQAPQTVLSLIR